MGKRLYIDSPKATLRSDIFEGANAPREMSLRLVCRSVVRLESDRLRQHNLLGGNPPKIFFVSFRPDPGFRYQQKLVPGVEKTQRREPPPKERTGENPGSIRSACSATSLCLYNGICLNAYKSNLDLFHYGPLRKPALNMGRRPHYV